MTISLNYSCVDELDEKDGVGLNREVVVVVPSPAGGHGVELDVEFKPIDHPLEPHDNEQPVKCPMPEPSILNDGRIWKERLAASVRRRGELPVMKEDNVGPAESPTYSSRKRHQSHPANHVILPSFSAPEPNLIKMLQEFES
ncbi:uncharacterized protein LOC18439219 isoform X2 [Amborella trichopoda]|uniref:uncharacterized protein LOC18439219 isoform X2 n=1 Tax=Amborella trichopoda TaxID=13333 RepID=UPI0009BD7B0D|nr:uncharacterized protein LOC18439219 isoform X2 [Amborella trichopoda]|eukprot:XP_020526156.1 uncharacterized protein LOC18439219 isoform X2 [Amborella trichopoda]